MHHHTKNKGDIGVLKLKADMCSKGYLILSPETEHAPFDFVVWKENSFKRVQAKYRTKKKNGVLELELRSCWSDSKGLHSKRTNLDLIDLIGIYCPENDNCYYLDTNFLNGRKSITLRIDKSIAPNQTNILKAEDFLEI